MTNRSKATVYEQVIAITHNYLGPAAERFIARQVKNHLHKPPADLSSGDLLSLIDWIRVAVSLLTEDSEIVEHYIVDLQKLASNQAGRKTSR